MRRIAKIGKAAKGEDGWFVALVVGRGAYWSVLCGSRGPGIVGGEIARVAPLSCDFAIAIGGCTGGGPRLLRREERVGGGICGVSHLLGVRV